MKVTNMDGFPGCSPLKTGDIAGWVMKNWGKIKAKGLLTPQGLLVFAPVQGSLYQKFPGMAIIVKEVTPNNLVMTSVFLGWEIIPTFEAIRRKVDVPI